MTATFETVTRWFQKATDTATKQGRHESALFWSDGLAHLIALNDRAEVAEARVVELEAAIKSTLENNRHLADGENCTLIALKRVMR